MWLRAVMALTLFGCGRVGFAERQDHAGSPGDGCANDIDCEPCGRCGADGVCSGIETIHDVFLGHRETCFLGDGGSRWCTGEESGLGKPVGASVPERIPTGGDEGWTTLAMNYGDSFGIKDGQVWEWGDALSVPAFDSSDGDWAQLTATPCFRRATGELTCGSTTVPGTWTYVTSGFSDQCAIRSDGTLWCWGTDEGNQLGQGVEADDTSQDAPLQVGAATDWIDVSCGDRLTCGRHADNTIDCWGDPDATGTNGVDTAGVPTQISTDTDWTFLAAHWHHACAGKPGGRVFCWGFDDYGLEVVPGSAMVMTPTELPGLTFDQLRLGGHHYCGLTGGNWYCWGWNAAGQLGVGDLDTHEVPTTPLCAPSP